MGSSRIQQPLAKFKKRLPNNIDVSQLIVFGSYLEGNATLDSDIDVIVVSDSFKTMDEDQRLGILYRAARDIVPEVQPWGFTPAELKAASRLTTLGYARDHGMYIKTN